MRAVRTVFIHGAGRSGRPAWPTQAAAAPADWVFLDRHPDGDNPRRDADRTRQALNGEAGHLVAASYGANAAMLAACQDPDTALSIILFEPACFDVARGEPAVEAHIAAMAPVYAAADDPAVSDMEFSQRFAAAMGTPAPALPPDVLHARVARLRMLPPPWGHGIGLVATSTLVVTGGWNDLYEQVATALVRHGARHVICRGRGHRPQDADASNRLMAEHWASTR
jgi:pimeloyl-ACP methyl ester carboxylesterase